MRKIIGWVALGLGAFLVTTAMLGLYWAPDQLERTPLDVDSVTRLDGTANRLNPATGNLEDTEVRATSFNQADSEASDDEVVVFVSNTCLVVDVPGPDCGEQGTGDDADPNVINVSEPTVFATDRHTAVAVNDPAYLPPGTPSTEGLVNKWPFDAQKTSYEVWDGLLKDTVAAVYQGEEEIDGLTTYVYSAVVEDQPAEVISGTQGLYSQAKTWWIEPTTGTIISQEQSEVRALPDGSPLLELDIAFTPDQVAANVEDTRSNARSLDLVTTLGPTIALILGLPLLLVGGALLLLDRRRRGARAAG